MKAFTAMNTAPFFLSALVLFPTITQAQAYRLPNEREGNWEASLMWKYQKDEFMTHKNGNTIAFDSTDRWGFTVGYNPSNHINIHWAFSYLKPYYTATIAEGNIPENLPEPVPDPATINHKSSITSNQLNINYNLLKGSFTPYVSAGLGWSNIDSNIVDSGGWICYPGYWGSYCSYYTSTYNETSFSYGWGAGLRWDVSRDLFIRTGINQQYVDFSGMTGQPTFESAQFEIGFRL